MKKEDWDEMERKVTQICQEERARKLLKQSCTDFPALHDYRTMNTAYDAGLIAGLLLAAKILREKIRDEPEPWDVVFVAIRAEIDRVREGSESEMSDLQNGLRWLASIAEGYEKLGAAYRRNGDEQEASRQEALAGPYRALIAERAELLKDRETLRAGEPFSGYADWMEIEHAIYLTLPGVLEKEFDLDPCPAIKLSAEISSGLVAYLKRHTFDAETGTLGLRIDDATPPPKNEEKQK